MIATANSAPVFTSLVLSKSTIYEGETVTLTGAFADPNAGDRHTILIYWYGAESDDKQKVILPAGQSTFQVSHTAPDALPITSLKVIVYDHELPPGSNDNTGGSMWDAEFLPYKILDAKPQFIPSSITITKEDNSSIRAEYDVYVTIEGRLAPPEAREPVQVTASWSSSPCPVQTAERRFRCEQTLTDPTGRKGHPVLLRVRDDEGNEATLQVSVTIP